MSETDILKKVQDKLDNERAKDIVTQMKNEPTELKIDIPDDPFIEKRDEILPDDGADLPPEDREEVDEAKKFRMKMVFDKRYTSGDADAKSQINYYIKKGVLRQPDEVKREFRDTGRLKPFSIWFKVLPKHEQDKVMDKVSDEWWKQYGMKRVDEIYLDAMVNDELKGDIIKSWDKYLRENMKGLTNELFWGIYI
tara:strand:- start:920 stop:1504 length:585 start_codon:yes stop_codon:yes gene_type:complete